jgi:hypothetical protein
MAGLEAARKQGAIALWNHPWGQQPDGKSKWQPIQQQLFDRELFNGISVANGSRYEWQLLDWCLDRGMTVYSNTDVHDILNLNYGEYRNQTIIFAKERSLEGVKQALTEGLTLGYSQGMIFGREELAQQLFEGSVDVNVISSGAKRSFVEITNNSGIRYELSLKDADGVFTELHPMRGNRLTLDPHSVVSIPVTINPSEKDGLKNKITDGDKIVKDAVAADCQLRFTVTNIYVRSDKHLEWVVSLSL